MKQKQEETKRDVNWLANAISWVHQVVEAADKPISLLVMVLLPLIAPLTPAILTGKSLGRFFVDMSTTEVILAILGFEFIGYLGMVFVVRSLMQLRKSKVNKTQTKIATRTKRGIKTETTTEQENLKFNFQFYLTAYVLYIVMLVAVNIVLEIESGSSFGRVLVIFCLTVGMSVGAGILNGGRLSSMEEYEIDFVLRQEKRKDKMDRFKIRHNVPLVALSEDVQLAQLAQPTVQVIPFPALKNALSGNWRKDEGKLGKKHLEWLRDMPKDAICEQLKLKPRTAYDWKNRATEKLQ